METLSNVYAPYIGANGNWYVDNEDTGVKAQGPKGDEGPVGGCGAQGLRGPKGETGDRGPQGFTGPKGDTPELVENLQTTETGKALDAIMGKLLDDKIANINNKLNMSGEHAVHTVFGTNSGSIVASGFIPLLNATDYDIEFKKILIAGTEDTQPLSALEIAGKERNGINIRVKSDYADIFKGKSVVITIKASKNN